IRIVNYAMLALLFALVASAYKVTYAVRHSEEHIQSLRAGLEEERKRMQVLQTDWEYLNNPQLLERWARKLDLEPLSPAQVIGYSGLPMPDAGVQPGGEGRFVLAVSRDSLPVPSVLPRPKPRFLKTGGAQ
ncbi:MAG: cell division protein FtsL, partial [bacterium]